MGYLKEVQTQKIKLPSNPEYWVEVKVDARYGDIMRAGAVKKDGTPDMIASSQGVLLQMITDWNLTDEKDEKLEITLENIYKLEPKDGFKIFEVVNNVEVDTPAQKKISTAKSS